jgi:hypothetical protein
MEQHPRLVRTESHADYHGASASPDVDADTTVLDRDPRHDLPAKRVFKSIRSLRRRVENGTGDEGLEALQAEVLLLREENAHLRIRMERTPELGDVVAQLRSLTMDSNGHEEAGDHAWHLLTEAVIAREALLDLCQRTREAMGALEARLQELAPAELATENGDSSPDRNGEKITLATAHGTASNGAAIRSLASVGSDRPHDQNHTPR